MFHVAASNTSTLTASRPLVWTGRALSGLVSLFLVVDAAMKIAALPIVAETAMTIDCRSGLLAGDGVLRSPRSTPGRGPQCSALSS
jgi:hypothetical protein